MPRLCTVDDCGDLHSHRGLCAKHHARLRKTGSLHLAIVEMTCEGCGSSFEVRPQGGVPRRWCSKVCRNRTARQAQLQPKLTPCKVCLSLFAQTRTNGRDALHCSVACRSADPDRNARARRYQHERRAIVRGADSERIDSRQVYEEDGWVCGICSEAVDGDLQWPAPKSPSLDHVIPLARGGHHRRDNVQLAHLDCNLRKSDAVPACSPAS